MSAYFYYDVRDQTLYLLRPGTLSSKETEQYFLWFSNGVLKLERTIPEDKRDIYYKSGYIEADFRGPFKGSFKFKLDFDFKLIDQESLIFYLGISNLLLNNLGYQNELTEIFQITTRLS